MRNHKIAGILAGLWLCAAPVQACNIALALAVDVSGSVDRDEFSIQMIGLANALRDEVIADLLVTEKARLALIQWSGADQQQVSIGWTDMADTEAVARFANRVEATPRAWKEFSTGLGEALLFSGLQLAQQTDCGRHVIDVSGDGESNEGIPPEEVRELLVDRGVTINAIAIEASSAGLTDYMKAKVIAGPSAFAMTARAFSDYPDQIRRKLLREVAKIIVMR